VTRDHAIARRIARWFSEHARELPWRTSPRDPYAALVAEVMAQQTQIARVAERFGPFLARFPTVHDLARARAGDVLALWAGLGYYRRARSLHAAAREIVERFDGRVPPSVADLRTLPGVGRYTAGAIASIAFGRPEPIVDGNVARVLLRIDGRDLTGAGAQRHAWGRAASLVALAPDPATFNEGLMELGATVCTPRSPRCSDCPVRAPCAARRAGRQDSIPRPKPAPRRTSLHGLCLVVRDRRGWCLVERRPEHGLWAGLWQLPTWESRRGFPRAEAIAAEMGVAVRGPIATIVRTLSHRRVRVRLYEAIGPVRANICRARPDSRWVSVGALAGLGVSSLQAEALRVAGLYSTPSPQTRRPGRIRAD